MILVRGIDRDRRTVTVESVGDPSPADLRALQRIDDHASGAGFQVLESMPAPDTGCGADTVVVASGLDIQCSIRAGQPHYRIHSSHDRRHLREFNGLLGAILATSELGRDRPAFNVAVYELLANCLEHGRRGGRVPEGKDALRVRITIGNQHIGGIIADRCDRFDPFSPENLQAADYPTPRIGRRGYGLRLVHQILDDFRYRRTSDGNIYLFSKDLKS